MRGRSTKLLTYSTPATIKTPLSGSNPANVSTQISDVSPMSIVESGPTDLEVSELFRSAFSTSLAVEDLMRRDPVRLGTSPHPTLADSWIDASSAITFYGLKSVISSKTSYSHRGFESYGRFQPEDFLGGRLLNVNNPVIHSQYRDSGFMTPDDQKILKRGTYKSLLDSKQIRWFARNSSSDTLLNYSNLSYLTSKSLSTFSGTDLTNSGRNL